MKCILSILSFLIFTSIASAIVLSPSENADVSITVDNEFPKIKITSPKNITYNNSTQILINFTIIELSIDTIYYTLDEGISNITIVSDPTFLSLPEGNYHLVLFINDTGGRTNSSSVLFNVNNSIAFCGNGYCSVSETCEICSEDCGSCIITSEDEEDVKNVKRKGSSFPPNSTKQDNDTAEETEVPKANTQKEKKKLTLEKAMLMTIIFLATLILPWLINKHKKTEKTFKKTKDLKTKFMDKFHGKRK